MAGTTASPIGLIGVVHLQPLPGDPGGGRGSAGFAQVEQRALADAEALIEGGVDGLIVENFGSAPFAKGTAEDRVPPHQVAALALISARCAALSPLPVGVNCLRNDAPAAMGIAASAGLQFIRVNVHCGAYVTDQGLIEGEAPTTLQYRRLLGAEAVALWADVLVKHAAPLVPIEPAAAVKDCVLRGKADAVIITGAATGAPVSPALLEEAMGAAGPAPVIIGSGFSPQRVEALAPWAHGAIVGTWVKEGGDVRRPVDVARVKELVAAARGRFATHAAT